MEQNFETENNQTPSGNAGTAPVQPEKKKKKHFTKKRELNIIVLSLAFCFTACFFAPTDIFIGNQHEFTVSAQNIIYPLLAAAGGASFAMFVFLNIVLAINVKLWKAVTSAFAGLLLAGYSQMMFMNSRMTTITGDSLPYRELSARNVINLVIFAVIALFPLILLVISGELRKKRKKKSRFVIRAITYVSIALLVMQSAGIFGRLSNIGLEKTDNSQYESFLSFEGATNLNKDENIIVFLADRLDADWMDQELEDYPELYDQLEGFTFYENNVACYTNTFPSVPQMLTGSKYEKGDWKPYIEKGWQGESLPKRLHDNGYTVNLILDNLTTYNSCDDLRGKCDNISSVGSYLDFNYFGPQGILRTMADFSLGKLSPYLLKSCFLEGYASDFSNRFCVLSEDIPERLEGSVGKESDLKFADYLSSNGIKTESPTKTFCFIHLNFSHDNNEDLAKLYSGYKGPVDRYNTTRGAFELLNMYFKDMKDAGVYDNSTIIVLGDHGRPPVEIEKEKKKDLDGAVRTTLLIKPAGAERAKLKIDREAELSNLYFTSSVLDYAGIEHDDLGVSYREAEEADSYPPRYLKVYCWHGIGRMDDVLKYEITGDASDFDNWKVVEREGKPATE